MFSEPIESFLLSTSADALTEIFIILLGACFIFALVLKKADKGHSFTQYAPTLLTSLGILGTFAGIIIGLLAFNVDDIDGSIGQLLSGLKTAFITSLVGMMASIVYKVLISIGIFSPRHVSGINEEEIGIAELYSVMQKQADGVESLKNAIGGDTESSLVGQMKLMRSDLGDQHKQTVKILEPLGSALEKVSTIAAEQQQAFTTFEDRLWIKLQDFADMMSKSATEQVINALKEVISDFNNNLIEQFGENFKQLNAAVLELVAWQENYKVQLGQMSEQYQLGVQAITQTEAAVSHISEESKVIPASMLELKAVMEVNQHQLQELERHLDAFKDIRDRAVEAVPEIRQQIDETVNGMKAATTTITEGMTKTTEALTAGLTSAATVVTEEIAGSVKKMSEGVLQSSDSLVSGINEAALAGVKGISDAATQMAEGVAGSSGELQKAITTGSDEFVNNSQRVNESLQGSSDVISTNSENIKTMFDDALTETNSVLRNLVADLKDDGKKMNEEFRTASVALVEESGKARDSMVKGIQSLQDQLGETVRSLADKQMTEHQRVLNGMSQHADTALKDTGEAVKKQVKMIEDATQHQLNLIMNEFGKALATITGRFTSDYKQLVDEMHRITKMRGDN